MDDLRASPTSDGDSINVPFLPQSTFVPELDGGGVDPFVGKPFVDHKLDSGSPLPEHDEERMGDAGHMEAGETEPLVRGRHLSTGSQDSVGEEDHDEETQSRSWRRKPSPWWLIPALLLSSTLNAMTMGPKIEVYNKLVCAEHRPEYITDVSPRALPELWSTVPLTSNSSDFTTLEQATNKDGKLTPPSALCRADSVVQAEVAKISTAMLTVMGILSVLTTGWWSSLSDRVGRTAILAVSILGILITDANFLLVAHAADRLPFGYRFLIVGPVMDGLLGGVPTTTAAAHAYIGDSTPASQRSSIFSINAGLAFVGVALGPTLGALLTHATKDLLSVFYVATAGHVLYALAIVFLIPESLSPRERARIARKRKLEAASASDANHGLMRRVFLKPVISIVRPLAIFIPSTAPGTGKKDYNLTFLAASYGAGMLMIGLYHFKFQFAQAAFGWNAEQLSYWFSVVGVVRAFHLLLVLPLIIKYFGSKPAQPISLPIASSEPLAASSAPLAASSEVPLPTPPPPPSAPRRHSSHSHTAHPKHSPYFDLLVARASLSLELLSEFGQLLAPSPKPWTLATLLGAFGGGFNPAVQALALGLLHEAGKGKGETGRLFGALGVVSALCSQVAGPALFGSLLAATVGSVPRAIFALACACAGLSLVCLFLIRLPRPGGARSGGQSSS